MIKINLTKEEAELTLIALQNLLGAERMTLEMMLRNETLYENILPNIYTRIAVLNDVTAKTFAGIEK